MTTRFAGVFLAAVLAVAPALADKKGPVTDGEIHDQVLLKLAGDSEVKGGGIDVQVNNGVVTLKGRVETEHIKQKADKLVKKVKGVKSVDDQLSVGPIK